MGTKETKNPSGRPDFKGLSAKLRTEYENEDLRKQREDVLEFLAMRSDLLTLMHSSGMAETDRRSLASPIQAWTETHAPRFPEPIRGRIRRLGNIAGLCTLDEGLRFVAGSSGYPTVPEGFPMKLVDYNGVQSVALPGVFERVSDDWKALEDYEQLLRMILRKEKALDKTHNRFPTPEAAHWGHVKIRVLDDERASVRVNEKGGIYTFAEMGMVDRRSGKPNRLWMLLRVFANNHGELTSDKGDAHPKYKKQKQDLDKALRAFFGINEPAFRLTDDRNGWRTRFDISRE